MSGETNTMAATTTTTTTGTVTITTAIADGNGTHGSITTTILSDETDGSATEGRRTMRTSFYLEDMAEGTPFAGLKALADGAAAHFGAVSDYLDSIVEGA